MPRKRRPVDYVTPELRVAVLARDGYRCVAPRLDPDAGPCTGLWDDTPIRVPGYYEERDLTIHHVQIGYGKVGHRAPSTMANCITVCWGHHTKTRAGRMWATQAVTLSRMREYLGQVPKGLGA